MEVYRCLEISLSKGRNAYKDEIAYICISPYLYQRDSRWKTVVVVMDQFSLVTCDIKIICMTCISDLMV